MEVRADRRKGMSYEYVSEKEIKPYRSECSRILTQLRDYLNEEYGIITQFFLVGSGSHARKLVMRNGNAPFDLDYNLMIIRMPEEYWNNTQCLKNRVRDSLNLVLRRSRSRVVRGGQFSDGKDSTSVITALMYTPGILSQVVFSFDLAILVRDEDGTYYRLLHDKGSNNYHWGEAPSVHRIREKADAIKSKRHWGEVRERYKAKKNMYLERQDKSHPSYIVYVETINEIYRKYFN